MVRVKQQIDMIQCPKCGAAWEGPDGANQLQFVICKECFSKLKLRPAEKAANPF
jgi:hypothetical protein